MITLIDIRMPDDLPQYGGTYHALCWWRRNRGTGYGS